MKHILLYGPTASGKSALAMALAERLQGVVINADAMQCYDNLKRLTARPDEDTRSPVPHYFYGTRDARQIYTAADWAEDCAELLNRLNRPAVICGGSGLYFEALVQGLSDLPNVAESTKQEFEARIESEGVEKLYGKLQKIDSVWAEKITPNDKQRIVRGLSIFAETGKSLSDWIATTDKRILLGRDSYVSVCLSPKRELLWQYSKTRLGQMIEQGAILEVAGLLRCQLNKNLPLMRAIGVPQFSKFLQGEDNLELAKEKAWLATRQYIKRQDTWGRTKFKGDIVLEAADIDKVLQAL